MVTMMTNIAETFPVHDVLSFLQTYEHNGRWLVVGRNASFAISHEVGA